MRRIQMEEEDNVAISIMNLVGYILVIVSVIAIVALIASWARPTMFESLEQLTFIVYALDNL